VVQEGDRVQRGTIVVNLPLDPWYASRDAEVPVTTGVAIPDPMSDSRHVAADRCECLLYYGVVAEVSVNKISDFLGRS
jgi:hypothetical protein